MARRILNRRELREENEASERLEAEEELNEIESEEEEEEEQEEHKTAKKAIKRKAKVKSAKEVRLKAYWGVFTQTLTQVAQYEYSDREEAVKRAAELTESKKTPHFVQLVKKVIEE